MRVVINDTSKIIYSSIYRMYGAWYDLRLRDDVCLPLIILLPQSLPY
jgi:hypothetical protein